VPRNIGLGKGLDALLSENDDDFRAGFGADGPMADDPEASGPRAGSLGADAMGADGLHAGQGMPASAGGSWLSGASAEGSGSHGASAGGGGLDGASADGGAASIGAGGSGGGGGIELIALDRLAADPGQPRKAFDEGELRELADSIAEHGVIQPIIAADSGEGGYLIIAGERRARAARLAGLAEIPAIIREYTDQKRLEVSLIENIQRSGLNPIEEAAAYKNLMDFSGLSQEELAARVGKNRSTVANALRLLKLPGDMQKGLESGAISPGHARALLSVADQKRREKLFREISAKGLSVREAEKRASAQSGAAPGEGEALAERPAPRRPPEIGEMEERLIERLGTKVSIEGGLEKGRICAEYYSMEDLDRLYGLFGAHSGD